MNLLCVLVILDLIVLYVRVCPWTILTLLLFRFMLMVSVTILVLARLPI